MAEGQGFEPWVPLDTPVFKTGAFDHSATPPVTFFNVASYSGNSEVHVRFIRNGSPRKVRQIIQRITLCSRVNPLTFLMLGALAAALG